MPEVLEKVKFTREVCDKLNIRARGIVSKEGSNPNDLAPFNIQVDGGIDDKTAKDCIEAGANVLVSGTYVFSAPNMSQAIQTLRDLG